MHIAKTTKPCHFTVLPFHKHIFFRFALILQVQLRSTEQTKAHARSQRQKAQPLRLKFPSPALFEWFEHDLSDSSVYSQLLAARGMGISCLMETLKSSRCVRGEMLEGCFQGTNPDGGRWALPCGTPRHGMQRVTGVTGMGSCWYAHAVLYHLGLGCPRPSLSIPVKHISCSEKKR